MQNYFTLCTNLFFVFFFLLVLPGNFDNEEVAESVENLDSDGAIAQPQKTRKKRNADGIELDASLITKGRALRPNVDRHPGKGKQ